MVRVLQQVNNAERNHCIDLLRGLCLFGVLWHHTCLYIGEDFVPKYMQQLSFFLEAPALFFVSGLTYQYVKREILINNIWRLSLSFTLISLIINGAMHELTLHRVTNPLFLTSLELPGEFEVLKGSYWFATCYVVILMLSMVVFKMCYKLYPWIMVVIFGALSAVYFGLINFRNFYVGIEPFHRVLFNWFFFLFGYLCGERILEKPMQQKIALLLVLVVLLLLCGAYWYDDFSVTNIHYQKYISGLPYFLFSLFGVAGFIWYYSPEKKNRMLEHVGKNSLYYFIGQGLACFVLSLIEPYLHMPWGIKLLLLFAINIVFLFICSEIFKFVYKIVVVKCLHLRG